MRQDQPVPTRRFSFLFTTFFPFPTRCLFSILRFLSLLHLPQLFFPSLLLFFCRCQRQPDIFPSPHSPLHRRISASLPRIGSPTFRPLDAEPSSAERDLRPSGDGTHGRSLSDCQWSCLPVCGAEARLAACCSAGIQ